MLDRLHPVLRMVCLALAALVLYQFVRFVSQKDPLDDLVLPAALSVSAAPEARTVGKETNAPLPTNVPSRGESERVREGERGPSHFPTRPLSPFQAAARKESDVAPAVQARIERITQSELLGPVIRPLPMALLGIAGKDAFLRAPNGQTGLLREGEELGGIKLLRIGTNRVLIEHEQQQKELIVFSGMGGETLLPKGKENPQ